MTTDVILRQYDDCAYAGLLGRLVVLVPCTRSVSQHSSS